MTESGQVRVSFNGLPIFYSTYMLALSSMPRGLELTLFKIFEDQRYNERVEELNKIISALSLGHREICHFPYMQYW